MYFHSHFMMRYLRVFVFVQYYAEGVTEFQEANTECRLMRRTLTDR